MSTTGSGDMAVVARLNCRVDARIKQRAEEAASLLGQSITDFTEMAIAEKANAVLAEHGRIVLSQRDFDLFVGVLEQPPSPTEKLRDSAREYRRLKETDPEGNW